jgi:hypothetical protein
MAKKSKLEMCVRCKKHHAAVGAYTGYYGVGLKGKKQIKGSFPDDHHVANSSFKPE